MKKSCFLAMTIICACALLLNACSTRDSIQITGISEEGGGLLSTNTDVKRIKYEFKAADDGEQFECMINGKKFVGNHTRSLISPFHNGDAEEYETTWDGGQSVQIRVNNHTKKLVAYFISYKQGYSTQDPKNLSYDECLQIALEKLREIDDGDYEQTYVETHRNVSHTESFGDLYSFFFRKLLFGSPTQVLVSVAVNTDGIVMRFNATEIFEFDQKDDDFLNGRDLNNEISLEEIKDKLAQNIVVDDLEEIEFKKEKSFYVKLKDGSINALCDISISRFGYDGYDYVQIIKKIR